MANPLASLLSKGGSMNLASLLQSMGINLADVEAQAKTIVEEIRSQINAIDKKLDTIHRQNVALASAMIELDKKLDTILDRVAEQKNGNSNSADDRNRGIENGDTGTVASVASNGGN